MTVVEHFESLASNRHALTHNISLFKTRLLLNIRIRLSNGMGYANKKTVLLIIQPTVHTYFKAQSGVTFITSRSSQWKCANVNLTKLLTTRRLLVRLNELVACS